jgi:hypothetical protein
MVVKVEHSEAFEGWCVQYDESGQSILEFLLLLPMLLGLTVLVIRTNTAIQVSIANQQWARAQALFLTFNSPIYPSVASRESNFIQTGFNQMMIGVSDNIASSQGTYVPIATVQNIARKANAGGSDDAQTVPSARAKVRVRTTVSLCTQPNVVPAGSAFAALLPLGGGPQFAAQAKYNLSESTKFDYCRSPLK